MPNEQVIDELGNETTPDEQQNEGADGAGDGTDQTPPQTNAEKSANSRTKAADKVSKSASKAKPTKKRNGKPLRSYTIMLNDSSEFPPGGLVLGKNGQFKRIPAEKPTKLDEYWMEVLNNAVQTEPRRDDNGRIIGVRNVPRFPYRIVPDDEE